MVAKLILFLNKHACQILLNGRLYMRGSRNSFKRGSKFVNFFSLVDKGIEDTNTAVIGHHQPASEMPLK